MSDCVVCLDPIARERATCPLCFGDTHVECFRRHEDRPCMKDTEHPCPRCAQACSCDLEEADELYPADCAHKCGP